MTEEILNEGNLNVSRIATEYSDGESASGSFRRAEGSSAEPNNSFETAYDLGTWSNTLSLGNLSISPASEEDYFKFRLPEGQILQITTSGVSGGDTIMYLYDNDHEQIGYNDDAQNYYSQIVASLEPGIYYIKVKSYQDAINNYSLKLEEFEVTDSVLEGEYNRSVTAYGDVLIKSGTSISSGGFPASLQVLLPDRTVTVENAELSHTGIRNAAILFGEDAYWGALYDGTVTFTGAEVTLNSQTSNCITAAGITGKNLIVNFSGAADNSDKINIFAGQGSGPLNYANGIYASGGCLTINGSFGGKIITYMDCSLLTSSRWGTATGIGSGSGYNLTINGNISGTILSAAYAAADFVSAFGLFSGGDLEISGKISGMIAALGEQACAISAQGSCNMTVDGIIYAGKSAAGIDTETLLQQLAAPEENLEALLQQPDEKIAAINVGNDSTITIGKNAFIIGNICETGGSVITIDSEARIYGDIESYGLLSSSTVKFVLGDSTAEDPTVTGELVEFMEDVDIVIDATRAENGTFELAPEWDIGSSRSITVVSGTERIASESLTAKNGVYTFNFRNGTRVDWDTQEGLTLDVGEAEVSLSDLCIKDYEVSAGTIDKNGSVKLTFKYANEGTLSAGASVLKVYDGNTLLRTFSMGSMAAGSYRNASVTLKGSELGAGASNIYLVADANNQIIESDESNNKTFRTVTVSQPDLYIKNYEVSSSSIFDNGSVKLSFQYANSGGIAAGTSVLKVYDGNTLLRTFSMGSVAAGSFRNASVTLQGSELGNGTSNIYLVADANNQIIESNESNNKACRTVTVTQAKPDLCIRDYEVSTTTVGKDGSVKLTFKYANSGTAAAAASTLKVYDGNTLLRSFSMGSVAAGSYRNASVTLKGSELGTGARKLYLVVDADNKLAESNESNNKAYRTVTASQPDLCIKNYEVSATSINKDGSVKLTFQYANSGGIAAGASVLKVYDGNTLLRTFSMGSVAAGSYRNATVTLQGSELGSGARKIYLVVDADNKLAESNESNNKAYRTVTVNNIAPRLFSSESGLFSGTSGDDTFHGSSDNDHFCGEGGNDLFVFEGEWGNDLVEQLDSGSVTLWFENGSEENWDSDTLTYSDGVNSVTVTGTRDITLCFGDTENGVAGSSFETVSEKIFENKNSGFIA